MDSLDVYEENKFDDLIINKDLPPSQINNYSYGELLNLNKEYNKQILKTIENLILEKKPLVLPKNDMKIINNLLQENYNYLLQIIQNALYKVEFDNLYLASLSILNSLSQLELKDIKIYQKKQKLKFMELKFHNYRYNGSRNDFLKAENLLEDMENIQKEKILENNITLIDISTILLYKAMTKFFLEDIEMAEEYAFESMDLLENQKDKEKYGGKKADKISNILDFIIEIYQLKKDFDSVISCYEKAYYLNAGKYGLNSPEALKYKQKKEEFEKNLQYQKCYYNHNNFDMNNFEDSYCFNENNVFTNKKLMQGNISNAKGTTDTFSFKIPITKNIEPMIISFYALNDEYIDDKFNSDLFLKNVYLDKSKLFRYYGINEHSAQQNYLLYTDDTVNDILANIRFENNQIIIENPMVLDALINC